MLPAIIVAVSACSEKTHYTEWDCGDATNKTLVKEALGSCIKGGGSVQNCGAVTQKLFCYLKRIPIRKNNDY